MHRSDRDSGYRRGFTMLDMSLNMNCRPWDKLNETRRDRKELALMIEMSLWHCVGGGGCRTPETRLPSLNVHVSSSQSGLQRPYCVSSTLRAKNATSFRHHARQCQRLQVRLHSWQALPSAVQWRLHCIRSALVAHFSHLIQ